MSMRFFAVLAISLVMNATQAFAALNVVKLKDARNELRAPAYTAEERKTMAEQALLFLENMYVHRELKIQDFGVAADPIPRLKDMVNKATTLKDDEFHEAMQKIFRDLHDLHTNYGAPLPLGCSYVIAPLAFRDVVDNGTSKILFERLTRITEKLPGEHKNAKPLDELVAVNGQPIAAYMETVRNESAGANVDAMTVFGLMNLTIRSLAELPVPKEDTITYTLKGAQGNYDIKADLFAVVNEESCVAQTTGNEQKKRLRMDLSGTDMENPTIRIWRKYVAPQRATPFADDPLNEIAQVADLDTPAGKITMVQLFTFMPEQSSIEALVHRMKDVLAQRQEKSEGLIIDIRSNGGGAVKLAEELVQIFTPARVEPMPVRFLPNELNLQMFLKSNDGNENGWSQDIRDAMQTHNKYTAPRVLTTVNEANRFGQVWFKPVVVLTDGACYSACDLFAAGMQDHAAATIIGTHAATGAGGANVMEYGAFRAVFGGDISGNPFKELPGHQSMRVSWRQTLRVGKNAGKLIENAGITPDILIRNTTADIATGESRELMRSIHAEIKKMLPRYKSKTALASSLRINNGDIATWSEDVKGIDSLEVSLDGKILKTIDVDVAGEKVEIKLDDVKGTWENKKFDVVGKIQDKIAFRVVRELYWRGSDIKLTSSGIKENFRSELKFLKTFVAQGSTADAWQTANGTLRVGKGPNYSPNIVTEAFFPLDVSDVREEIGLLIDFSLESEEGMDTMSILVRDPDTGRETYLYTLDGVLALSSPVLLPIPHNGKRVEVVLEFESDENWNMKGPIVKTLGVQSTNSFRNARHHHIGL